MSSIITTGKEKVTDICSNYNISVTQFISSNSGIGSVTINGITYDNLGSYLNTMLLSNEYIKAGIYVIIPGLSSGGIQNDSKYDYQYENHKKNGKLITNSKKLNIEKFGCYFSKYAGGSLVDTYALPVYPQEFSDTNSAEFNSQSMFGRSVAYQIYNTSSRSVSFTLQLHEELVENNYEYIHQLVSEIESACYPEYGADNVQPPEVMFTIGKHFKIRGILSNCSATWTPPIIGGKLINCSLSIGVVETTGPYSMSDISKFKGYRK